MVSSLDYLAFILNYAMRLGVIGQLITRIVIYLIIFAATALIVRRRGRADLTEAFDKFPPVASLMIYAAFLAAYYSVTVSFNAEYAFVRAHRRMHSVSGYKISYRFAEKARDGEAA